MGVIIAIVLLLLGVVLCVSGVGALRKRAWISGALRGVTGLLFVSLGALAGTITVGIRGYRALTHEALAATVKTEPLAPQRFRATIFLSDGRLAMYELAGDAFYIDAHILKWHTWVNLLGLHTSYELDRVTGRYNVVADERNKEHTVYSVGRERSVDLFGMARRKVLGPLVDAEYGSAAFVAGTRGAEYEVLVSTTGLLLRPVVRPARP